MKLFIQKVIVFTLPIALFMVGAEYIIRKTPNNYSYKNEYLYNNSEKIEILILGSSHSFFGINPIYFTQNAFNAAHVSQTLNYDFFIFNKYKNKLTNLKTLMIPVSYFTFFYQLENGVEDWRVKNYCIYYDKQCQDVKRYNYEVATVKPLSILKNIYKYIKGSNHITVSELGFGLNYSNTKQSDLIATGVTAAQRHTIKNLDLLDVNINLLNKIITESNANGIRVMLFTPPATKSYTSNLNKVQLSIMKSNIDKIIREYSNVEYYDFMNDSHFIATDFKNADHLNGIGAKKLTQLLERIIVDKKAVYTDSSK